MKHVAEILEDIRGSLAILSVVGRPLTDDEQAEVLALTRMLDAARPPAPAERDDADMRHATCDNCGTSWWATEPLPCPNGCALLRQSKISDLGAAE